MISCLTVTQHGREAFLREATSDFEAQTFPNREHIIVVQPSTNAPTLGELRNQTLERAQGEFFCQWDDDDRYHRERLTTQHRALEEVGADLCFIERITVRCLCGFEGVGAKRTWENTIFGRRASLSSLRYPTLKKAEDTAFVECLLAKGLKVTFVRQPELYTYRIHAGNTWSRDHFDRIFQQAGLGHRPSLCSAYLPPNGEDDDAR